MIVTAIEPRKGRLYAVYLDGELIGEIDADTWEMSHFRLGREISREEYDALWEESNRNRAKSYALYLLTKQNYTRKGLLDKIRTRHDAASAEFAVERMEELRLLDDEEYARRYCHDLIELRHFSAYHAKQALLQKGIDREIADRVLEELAPDPVEQICELLRTKYARKLSDEKGRERTVASLQRGGFRWEHIKTAMRLQEEWPEE